MYRWLDIIAAVFAFLAALFWFVSAWGEMPPILPYWDQTPESDPFYKAVKFSARVNRWAALFSGVSALCAGVRLFVPALCIVVWMTLLGTSYAQDDQVGQQSCINQLGRIFCPPPNGTAIHPLMGDVVCGHGQCVKDAMGQFFCSRQPGGYAFKDAMGQITCTGGCETASSFYCQMPRSY
jgi:hypothetical protein